MKQISRQCAWILALLPVAACAVDAQNLQSPEELRQWAEAYLEERLQPAGTGQQVTATAGALDPFTRLQRCAGDLAGILPAGARPAAKMTLGIRCASPAWTIYLPMTVQTTLDVLVARAAAPRNTSLAATDVELQQRTVPGIATTFLTSVDQLRGRHLKVAIAAGTPLSAELLAADIMVRRGQRVTLVAGQPGIEVRAQGEALADATATGRVRVLNLSSRKIVEGQAESADRVRVDR